MSSNHDLPSWFEEPTEPVTPTTASQPTAVPHEPPPKPSAPVSYEPPPPVQHTTGQSVLAQHPLPPPPVRRSAFWPVVAALIVPGAGNLIRGRFFKGLCIFLLWLGAWVAAGYFVLQDQWWLVGAALVLVFVMWCVGLGSAQADTRRWNVRHGAQ